MIVKAILFGILVHEKRSLIFGPFWNHSAWTKCLMYVLDRTKFQEHFGVDQMSYGHFGQGQISANQVISQILTSQINNTITHRKFNRGLEAFKSQRTDQLRDLKDLWWTKVEYSGERQQMIISQYNKLVLWNI